jgi:urate oxidase
MTVNMSDRFAAANNDFQLAIKAAQTAFATSTSPVIRNLIFALAKYSLATNEAIVVVSQQLDDINRNINNVAARLDGKKGPFNLHMR